MDHCMRGDTYNPEIEHEHITQAWIEHHRLEFRFYDHAEVK